MFKKNILVNTIIGDYMRKILVLIIILIICVICSLFYSNEDDSVPVFNEQNSNYDIYMLDISNQAITTNNLADYFDGITILEIYPYINPIYKKLIKLSSYTFNTAVSNKKNISNFITEYNNQLEKNALSNEEFKYYINGIKIEKIKVYTSSKEINSLINKYSMKVIK